MGGLDVEDFAVDVDEEGAHRRNARGDDDAELFRPDCPRAFISLVFLANARGEEDMSLTLKSKGRRSFLLRRPLTSSR